MANGLFDCAGKVTLVTGGNGGIGLGFATGVAKMGGDIAIWARNADKNAEAKAALEAAGAGRVETYQVDVSSEAEIVAGYATLLEDFGRVDCVFANSGRASKSRSVLTLDSAEWHDLMAVNLHGAFFTLREGAKAMVARAEAGRAGRQPRLLRQSFDVPWHIGHQQLRRIQGRHGRSHARHGRRVGQIRDPRQHHRARLCEDRHRHQRGAEPEMEARIAAVDAHFAAKTPIHRPGKIEDFEGIGAYLVSDASQYHGRYDRDRRRQPDLSALRLLRGTQDAPAQHPRRR
jgi:hypothetical protein